MAVAAALEAMPEHFRLRRKLSNFLRRLGRCMVAARALVAMARLAATRQAQPLMAEREELLATEESAVAVALSA
jgi:hypothetical protein